MSQTERNNQEAADADKFSLLNVIISRNYRHNQIHLEFENHFEIVCSKSIKDDFVSYRYNHIVQLLAHCDKKQSYNLCIATHIIFGFVRYFYTLKAAVFRYL